MHFLPALGTNGIKTWRILAQQCEQYTLYSQKKTIFFRDDYLNICAPQLRTTVVALTSKSPKAVVLAALATARRALPEHAHRYSPKKFTQHQLFACLVLKNFLRTDYRGLAAHLVGVEKVSGTNGIKTRISYGVVTVKQC
jgi:hypothetical protein